MVVLHFAVVLLLVLVVVAVVRFVVDLRFVLLAFFF